MINNILEHLFANGANWVKTDFHLHSPFVNSFKLPSGINLSSVKDINKLIDDYIKKLKEQEIKICAITDYQQIRKEWFVPFQKVAAESNICVFPGVELSISYGNGLHIIIIADYNYDLDGFNDYIKSLDRNPHEPFIKSDRSHRDIILKDNLSDVLIDLRGKLDCLIIFPHPEDKNGLIKEFQPKEAAEYLKLSDAIEYIGQPSKDKLISTGLFNNDAINNKLALIESSDPKSLDEVGNKLRDSKKRCTYLKLSSVSVNSFRIALQDPLLRVNRYQKPDSKIDRIISLEIVGSQFLKSVKLNLNQELNSFIGGRGVGKSAIIESIRYCLDLPAFYERSFKETFVSNVVGSGGKICLTVERQYGKITQSENIQRIIGKLPEVAGRDLPPSELFENKIPILIGQKELYHLSSNKSFQLNLIDELIGDDIKKENQSFKKQILQLEENARQLLNLFMKIEQKEDYEQKLKTVNEHIKVFENLGVAEKMQLNTTLLEDDKRIKDTSQRFAKETKELNSIFIQISQFLEQSENSLAKGKSKEKHILEEASALMKEFQNELILKQKEINKLVDNYSNKLTDIIAKWDKTKSKYDDEINNIKKQLSAQGLSADKYENLIKDRNLIEPLIRDFKKVEQNIKQLMVERESIKKDLQKQRHSIFSLRKNRIEEINKTLKGRVKLDPIFENNKDDFKDKFRSILRGSNITANSINSIIDYENITIDGIELSKMISEGKDKLQEVFGLTDAMSERIINWFGDKDKLFELETFFPDDKIKIFLNVDGDNKEFDKLSDGQKATALLILLFSQEDRILIIDQPEEDLDNRFIYDDVVKILRELKGKRQIILATHNANIPVLGDSEQVFVLESSKEEGCKIIDFGSIDRHSITENIKNIMEGGEEAFRRRIEKYGVKL